MGNVYHITVLDTEDLEAIAPGKFIVDLTEKTVIDVHGADDAERVIKLLKEGKTPSEIRKMICPTCLQIRPCGCGC